MRIGLIASPWIPVPPPRYGGSEAVIDNLARGLEAAGHDVVLFTVEESTCPVPRRWVYEQAAPLNDSLHEAVHVEAAYRALADVDVIHDHTTIGPLLAAHLAPAGVPVVTTVHGPFTPVSRRLYQRMPSHVSLISISHPHRATAGDVPVTAVIPHGIDTDLYVEGPGGGGYLAFVGRMNPDKGVHTAIEVARRAGMPLLLMVKIREDGEKEYFENVIKPMLGSDVELLVEPDTDRRITLLGKAEALINPIQWPEPFGLVMAESLACATPVLARPNGAATEIVEPGVTGFLSDDVEGLTAAALRIGEIDRADCRSAAERRFSSARMVADHVRLYRRLVDRASVPSITSGRRRAGSLRGIAR